MKPSLVFCSLLASITLAACDNPSPPAPKIIVEAPPAAPVAQNPVVVRVPMEESRNRPDEHRERVEVIRKEERHDTVVVPVEKRRD